jgi:hypothetical protein
VEVLGAELSIYGVLSFEVGPRMAAIALGLGAALELSRLLERLLFE